MAGEKTIAARVKAAASQSGEYDRLSTTAAAEGCLFALEAMPGCLFHRDALAKRAHRDAGQGVQGILNRFGEVKRGPSGAARVHAARDLMNKKVNPAKHQKRADFRTDQRQGIGEYAKRPAIHSDKPGSRIVHHAPKYGSEQAAEQPDADRSYPRRPPPAGPD